MKRSILLTFLLLFIASVSFAQSVTTLVDGTNKIIGTTTNPLQVEVTGDINLDADQSIVLGDASIYFDTTEDDLVINTGSKSFIVLSDGSPIITLGVAYLYFDGTDVWVYTPDSGLVNLTP